MMKKIIDIISAVLFFSIIIMFTASAVLYQVNTGDISKLCSLADRKTAESYASGIFPLSENWWSMYSSLTIKTGQEKIGDVYATDNRLIEVFDSADVLQIETSVEQINQFSKRYKDIPMYAMLVPTASGIYSADLPILASAADQQKLIDDIYYKLDKHIVTLDAYNPLFSSRDDYIYFKTDSRWTAYGAYVVYEKVINKLGFQAVDLSNYDIEYADRHFLGNLYEKTYYGGVDADTINIFKNKNGSFVTGTAAYSGGQQFTSKSVYYNPALKTDDKYGIFLNGDSFGKYTVYTSNENAPRLLIIKGSYANCFVPFLTPHYSEITLIDLKQFEGGRPEDIADPEYYDQILFLYDIADFNCCDDFYLLNGGVSP